MAKKEESTKFIRSESRTNYLWEHAAKIGAHGMMEFILMSYGFLRNWTTMFIGESGAGKNDIPRWVAQRLGLQFICFNAVNKEPTELAMPFISNDSYRFQIMEAVKPAFNPGWKGILHIEEYPQAEMQMRRVLYSLIYERRLDDHKLSDGCMIVLSGNPPSNSVYNLADLDLPVEDRIGIMPIETKAIDWLRWARKDELSFSVNIDAMREKIVDRCGSMNPDDQPIHQLVISLVDEDPGAFYELYGRRLHHFSDAIHAIEKYFDTTFNKVVQTPERKQFAQYVLTSVANPDFTTRFMQFVIDRTNISGAEILMGSKEHMDRMKKSLATSAKTISLNTINTEMIDAVLNHESILVTVDEAGNKKEVEPAVAARNYIHYLGVLVKHEPDTAVALMHDMIPKAESKWAEFNRAWDVIAVEPALRWIVEKICDLQGVRDAFESYMTDSNTDTTEPPAEEKAEPKKRTKNTKTKTV